MRIRRFEAAICAIAASAIACSFCVPCARADVRFDPLTGYFPSGYTRPTSTFDTTVPLLAAGGSALELGYTQSCPQNVSQAMISAIGPVAGSTLARSTPVIPYFDTALMASVPGAAEPTVVVAGTRTRDGFVSSGIEVFAGWPPSEVMRVPAPIDIDAAGAIVVTRYVDAHDFDIADVDTSGVRLFRVAGATASVPWGKPLPNGRDVAFVPASGPMPALVVAVGDADTAAFDATTGEEIWSAQVGGQKIAAGTIGVSDTPAFVVADPYFAGVTAYAANPPAPLWRRADLLADSVLIDDVTGDGHKEVMVGTPWAIVQRLSAAGVNFGAPLTLPGATGAPDFSTALAKAPLAGTVPRFLIAVDSYLDHPPRGMFVYPMNLADPIDTEPAQPGVCNAVGVADVDGDGQDEIITTGELPGYDGTGWRSTVRIAGEASGREEWIGSLPPAGSSDMYVDFDIGNLGQGTDRDIVLAGPLGQTNGVVSVLNGQTHLLVRRGTPAVPGANHVTAVRIVPLQVPAHELVLVGSDWLSTTLHVINAATLQTTFSSDAIAPAPDGGSFALATFAGDASAHAIFTAPLNGVYSYDLGTHALDYAIPASASVGALLAPVEGVTRFAYADWRDGGRIVVVIDAATGAEIDALPIGFEVLRMTGDPNDPQRLVAQDADRLVAMRLDTHSIEGHSSALPTPPYNSADSLVVRASGGSSIAYAGTSAGVYAFRLTPTEPSIFEDGFDR